MSTTPDFSSKNQVFHFRNRQSDLGAKIWTMTFDLPGEKVNKFDARVMGDIAELLPKLKEMGERGEIEAIVVLSSKPGIFIAGADIQLIRAAKTAEEAQKLAAQGQHLLNLWEDLPFPRVVAINGAALGGGCEFSLASSAIVMSSDSAARIGLPETMLGIIPGMGGCVRLATKVGLATALEMILGAPQFKGEKAFKAGLADAYLPKEDFETSALAWVKNKLPQLKAGKRLAKEPKLGGVGGIVGSTFEYTPFGRAFMLSKARGGVIAKTRGKYPAPLEAIEVLRDIGTHYGVSFRGKSREKAMEREARGFGKMAATDISKNLIRLFFLTEGVKKNNGVPTRPDLKVPSFESTAVLGAGVMGGGIAHLFVNQGIRTRMKDISSQALQIGINAITTLFKKAVKRRKLSDRQAVQKLTLVTPTLDFNGFKGVDLVVEAVVEKMEIKKSVLKDLENHVRPECVVATNTSSLSVSEMQSVLSKPERFVGMHFFNPVHRMPLIEVIRGSKTSDETVVRMFEFCKRIGKTPIVVKDAPGFLVNRLLVPYMNEAAYLLMEGAPIEEIDRALVDFGMPMGPMELVDEVGVDVGDKVLHILHDAFGERMVPAPGVGKLVEKQRMGKKNSKGLYRYEGTGDRKEKKLDPEVYQLLGIKPQPGKFKPEEMVARCILPMINEAARCLEEKIVETPEDCDLGMIMGTGFPPFRGGLLRYADSLGAAKILAELERLEKVSGCGVRFSPSGPIKARAQSGASFYQD